MAAILILYHSQQFGNTRLMAEAVAEGAQEPGSEVTLVNTNEQRLDIDTYRDADAVAFGSPDYFSYIAGGLKVFLDDWFIAKRENDEGLKDKPYGLFYSHGGGGNVKEPMEKLFARLGTQVGDTIESKGAPDEAVLKACRELGTLLRKTLQS